jgi:hypothetical protein
MVIAGLITSLENEHVEIIADSTLVGKSNERSFILNFPLEVGYDADVVLRRSSFSISQGIAKFIVKTDEYGYDTGFIKKVPFSIKPVKIGQDVNVFTFPRDKFITPTGYWPGSVM